MNLRLLLVGLVGLPWVVRGVETSSVWRVEGGRAPMAVAGSIHLLPRSAYPLPVAFGQAYEQAEVVVFELLMDEMFRPEALRRVQETMMKSEGGEEISAELRERLHAVLKERGLPPEAFEGMAAWAVVQQLALFELQRHGISPGHGVDLYFTNLAKRDGKKRIGLETLEEQLGFLRQSGGNGEAFLRETLDRLPQAKEDFERLEAAWRRGDREALAGLMRDYFKNAADLDETLLRGRNRAWIPQLEALLQGDQPVMVIVGAGHLSGPENVLELLEARGYRIAPWR